MVNCWQEHRFPNDKVGGFSSFGQERKICMFNCLQGYKVYGQQDEGQNYKIAGCGDDRMSQKRASHH